MTVDASLVGLRHSATLRVDEGLTVPHVSDHFAGFQGMPPVFATAYMVAFIESSCIEALQPWLDEGQGTVGTHVDVSHVAATPVGMDVTAEVELTEVDGRSLRFRVSVRDECDLICEGQHQRALIDRERFITRVNSKAGG